MLLGVIADDFTGASDIANTLAREGMKTRLFVGTGTISDDCDAGVIALKSRSIPAAEAVLQSLAALDRLRASGCRQFVFKYCSTFDSTPQGNIGPVAEALATALGARGAVVCPAFPATGRTVYQGHLFVGDRLLSESGMERHPLSPMTDPDLRRWLARQGKAAPGHVAHATVRAGPEAIREALAAAGAMLVVVDAIDEGDLRAIGEAVADAPLVTGGSGIALGLPTNFRQRGLLSGDRPGFAGNSRPALLLSGSCSTATRSQVGRHEGPAFEIDVDSLIGGGDVAGEAEAFVAANRNDCPLIFSTADPARVKAMQARHGAARAADAVETLFGEIARRAVAAGFGRIVVAGGETSGAVVTALGLARFDLGPEIDPGVPALSSGDLALALKSGNFGAPNFFDKAVKALGERA